MTIDNLDDNSEDDFDFVDFNIERIKAKIPGFTSKKLCEMIVCDRYFGCYKEMAAACMEELAKRRLAGDDFKFEEVIDGGLKELPVLDFVIPDLGTVLRSLIGTQVNKK